ncbi:uncharacterized protein LOC117101311 [Anneissia japonica]|uniref:uncharacterized protein LOC117101311 n=1 Tax=Anneissia japonica TaxID=1529436 RepID=UPI00142590C6|nr:uncharacterized protein LOC117101311 [Anneissia japonica]
MLFKYMSLEILELFDNNFGRASTRNGFYPGISNTEGVNLKEPLNNLLRTQECEPLIGDTWQENGSDLDSHGKIGMFSTDEDTRSSQLNVSISDSDTDWTSPLFNIANKSSSVDIVTNALEDLDMDHSNPVDPCTQMPIPQEVKHGNMLNGNLLNDSQSSMETTLPEDSSMDLNTSHGSMDSELTEVNGSTDYSSDKLEDTELQIVEEPVVTRDSASTEQAFFKSNVSTPRSQDSMNNNSNNIYNSNHILSGRDSTDFDDEDDDADGACSSKSRNSGYIEFKVEEILESERSYVKDLDDIVEGYLLAILDRPTLPLKPEDYQALFSNLESIRDFNKEFLKDLEDCDHDPVLIAECFLEKEEDFIMYSQYCTNYPSAVKVLTKCLHQPVMCKFFQDAQNKLGHALPLGAYLLKPVQRILKYHLLFHDLCKHINTDDEIYDTLEEALDAMKEVAKQINHMKAQSDKVLHVQQIQSQLLDQDDVMRLQGSRGDRNVYLFEKAFFIAKRREDGYISIKTEIKCSNLLLMENIPKETFGFTVMPFDNRDEQHILVAKGLEQKHLWTHQIKKMILENFKGLIPSKAKDIVLNNQSGSSGKDGEKDTSTKEQPVKLRKRKPRSKQRRRRRHSDPPSQLRRGTVQVKVSPTETNEPPTTMGMKKPDVAKLMTNKRASSLVRSEGICSTEESMSESESSNSPNRLSTVQVNDKDDTTEMSQVETNNHQNQNIDLPKDEQTDDDLDEHNDQPLPEPEAIEETCPNMKNNVEEVKMEEHDEDSPDELDILETLHDTIENIIQEEGVKMGNKKETSPFQLRSNIKDLKPKKAESIELDSEDVWIKRPIIRGVRVSGDRPLDRPLSADILTNSSHSRRSLSRSVSSGYQTLPKVMKAQSDPNFLSTKIKSEPVLNKTGEGNMSESNSSIMSSGLDQTCSSHESILESFEDSIEYGLCASGDAHQLQSSNDDFAKETIKNNEPVQVKQSPRSKDSDCKSKVSTQTDSGKSLHKTVSADISAISRNMRLSKVFKMARDYSQRVKRTSRPAIASLFNSDNDQSNDKPTTEVMHNKTDNGSSFVKSNKSSPTYHEEEVPVFDPTVPSIVEGKETAQEEKKSAIKVESRLLGISQADETERKSREIYRTSAIKRSKSAETISNAKLSLRIFEDAPDEPVGDFKRGPSIKDRLRSIKEKTTYQKKNEIKDLPQKFKSLKERQKDLEKCVTKPIPKTNKEVEKLIATNIEAASEDDEVDSKITKLTRHSSCSSVSSIQLTPSNESRHRSWSSRSSGLDQEDVVFRSVKQRQLLLQMAYSKPVPKTVNVSAEINTEIPKSSWRLSDNSR